MVWRFFVDNIPSWQTILMLGPFGLIYSFLMLYFAGFLKMKKGWRTGYTRKVFHFSIFGAAGLVQVLHGYQGIIVFGSAVSVSIFYSVWRGEGNLLFEAMAREKDAPKKAYFILVPYFATLAGGLLNNFLFPEAIAVFGYLVTGIGDAIAEPVGTRFGKHKYRVLTARKVVSYRSLEGSAAVFAGSVFALILAAFLSGLLLVQVWPMLLLVALVATFTEALSPHGWDNFTLQVITALSVYFLISM